MRAVQDAGGVVRDAAGADAAPRGEVAAAVEDDLVAAHRSRADKGRGSRRGGSRAGAARSCRSARRAPRTCRAPSAAGAPGRRAAESAGSGTPRDRPCRPSPTTSSGECSIAEAVERAVPLDQQIAQAFLERAAEVGAAKVAVAVGRVHAQLADLVAPLLQQAEAGGALDAQPVLRPGLEQEAVRAARAARTGSRSR